MKVFVTGISGFIGSHVASGFLEMGDTVLGASRTSPSILPDGLTTFKRDLSICKINDLLAEVNPDIVVHCAGSADVRKSVTDPVNDFDHNVRACYNVLESIRDACPNARFIFLSSAAVYGSPNHLPVDENSEINPISPYGLHKRFCEELCSYYRQAHGLHADVARIFSAYGNGQKKQFFWDFYCKYRDYGNIELFGTGEESRDFIHIHDLVKAIRLIALYGENTIYNIANGIEVKMSTLANLLSSSMGIPQDKMCFSGECKQGDPKNWCANIEKLKSIGYQPTVSIEQGVLEYSRWISGQ